MLSPTLVPPPFHAGAVWRVRAGSDDRGRPAFHAIRAWLGAAATSREIPVAEKFLSPGAKAWLEPADTGQPASAPMARLDDKQPAQILG